MLDLENRRIIVVIWIFLDQIQSKEDVVKYVKAS